MKTKLFYFSGTGNSLKVAKDIAAELGNTEVVSIPKVINQEIDLSDTDGIGFIFPVYIWGLPVMVKKFVEKITIPKTVYVFSVSTHGGMPAATQLQMKKILKKKGTELAAGWSILMPGNYTPMYGAIAQEKQEKQFADEEKKIKDICTVIKKAERVKIEKNNIIINFIFSTLIYNLSAGQIHKMSKDFWVNDKCKGCPICVKVCPANNIKMNEDKPKWDARCEQCLACLQWCPEEAIEFGKKTVGRKRYRHPQVKVGDLIDA